MARRDAPRSLRDVDRRRREDLVANAISLEMLAEQIVIAEDGSMIARAHGREYKIEVKALEMGAQDVPV